MTNTPGMFGEKRFGEILFGQTTLTRLRFGLSVDWDSTGSFSGENEAIAGSADGDGMVGFTIERGRRYTLAANGEGFEQENTGTFSSLFIDRGRRFDPFNHTSPLYGKMAGGKFFRFRVRTASNVIYPLFMGIIKTPLSSQEEIRTARLEGEDGWALLRDQRNLVTVQLQENIYADQAIELTLNDAGWPTAWGRALDAGVDLRTYWWVDQRSPAATIHDLAHKELGTVCVAADGALVFRNQIRSDSPVLTVSGDDIYMGSLRRLTPDEVVRNIIRVRSSKLEEYSQVTVWQQADRLRIAAGATEYIWADFTYNNQSTPVKSPVTPVATTDYTASANSDGSGANYTANMSVTMLAYSTKGYITIKNNGANAAWFLAKVRGNPIVPSNTSGFEGRDDESIRQYGARSFDLDIQQDVNTARQYRDLLLAFFRVPRNYLVMDLLPNPDIQFAVDLGQRVIVFLPDEGINEVFSVIYIRHQSQNSILSQVSTRWILEPVSRVITGFQIPVQVPFQVGQV